MYAPRDGNLIFFSGEGGEAVNPIIYFFTSRLTIMLPGAREARTSKFLSKWDGARSRKGWEYRSRRTVLNNFFFFLAEDPLSGLRTAVESFLLDPFNKTRAP